MRELLILYVCMYNARKKMLRLLQMDGWIALLCLDWTLDWLLIYDQDFQKRGFWSEHF